MSYCREERLMKRSTVLTVAATLSLLGLAVGQVQAQYPSCQQPPWTIYYAPAPAPSPFVGANYSLYAPSYSYGAYYQAPYPSLPYVRNYTGPGFGGRVPTDPRYPNPGPYYYTPAY